MRIDFLDKKLQGLYTQEKGARRLDPEVYEAFLEVVAAVQAAKSPQDLRALKSLHYEKLKGDRKTDRSLRLHKGYRLIVREQRDADGIYIEIIEIDDYHRRER
ncbi:MAG: type II toxin-antitoxin system RelE/ParE family toxin [Actinomycetes bacterium]